MKTKLALMIATLAWLAALSPQLSAAPLGTAFTYQGRLTDGTNAAQGIYDLRFTIYDAATSGRLVAGPLTNSAVGVSNGLFTTTLDFGSAVFTGEARWLEIGVRPAGSGSFTPLAPRQPFTAAPYALAALTAASVPATNLTGILSDALLSTNVARLNASGKLADSNLSSNVALLSGSANFAGAVTATAFSGNGSGLTGVPGAGGISSGSSGTNVTLWWGPSSIAPSYVGAPVAADLDPSGTFSSSHFISGATGTNAVCNGLYLQSAYLGAPYYISLQTNTGNGLTLVCDLTGTYGTMASWFWVSAVTNGSSAGVSTNHAYFYDASCRTSGPVPTWPVADVLTNDHGGGALLWAATNYNASSGFSLTGPITTSGYRTNLETLIYEEPDRNGQTVDPVPTVYWLWEPGAFISHPQDETNILTDIQQIATNGVPFGLNYLQLDAGWSARDSNGKMIFNPNSFPTMTGRMLCDYAHKRGVRIGLYVYSIASPIYGGVSTVGYEVSDAWMMATNFLADGIKTDFWDYNEASSAQTFASAIFATGRPMYRQASCPAFPFVPKYYQSAYYPINLPDTVQPYNFGNIYYHFWYDINNLANVGPGFCLESTGWMQPSDEFGHRVAIIPGSDGMTYPHHVSEDLSAMVCSRLMFIASDPTMFMTVSNADYLSILRDPQVVPARTVITTTNNGTVNFTMVRQLGAVDSGVKAVCFLNALPTAQTMTVDSNRLGLASSVYTYYSPWYHAIEGWATNSISALVPPTNTVLYRVVAGFQAPSLVGGTNYLSDQPWRSTVSIPNGTYGMGRDQRAGVGGALTVSNSLSFAKGLSMGWGMDHAATSAEFSLGGKATSFSVTFGKGSPYLGYTNSGWRLSVYLDGVLAAQTAYIGTNSAVQYTNLTLDVTGKNAIKLAVDCTESADPSMAVLGNCYVIVPTSGTFAGDGGGLTDLNAGTLVGTVSDARLSANVARLSGTNLFAGTNYFSGVAVLTNSGNVLSGTFTGNGGGLTNLSANAITGGLTTNIAVLVPGGVTNTLFFTNGILRAVR